jgi:hypothetical protein
MGSVARSESYLAHGSLMTVLLGITYYLFSNPPLWTPRLCVFFGTLIVVAYGVGFTAAYRNKIERNYANVSPNE